MHYPERTLCTIPKTADSLGGGSVEGQADEKALAPGFLEALCRTYADLLRRQRTAASPLVNWTHTTSKRSHDFVWLGGAFRNEQLLHYDRGLVVAPGHPVYGPIHKMYGTAKLNPYEREILYGFPYVIGRRKGKTVRGPLLTLAVEIEAVGNELQVVSADEVVRFNSLPFRTDIDTDAHDQALARVMEATPALPLTQQSLQAFVGVLTRELPSVTMSARLDGTLDQPPAEPDSGEFLRVIDQAALFVAPKTNYFLRSDLEEIAKEKDGSVGGALVPFLSGAGAEEQVDFADDQIDSAKVYFPFPSNRAQRRVALLIDDESTSVVRVEGPPGTGKSLTIANLACHLAATGKRVLITSQKDKALDVVDKKLRELNLPALPMTLLRHDRESKRDLLLRLDRVEKRRSRDEVETEYAQVSGSFDSNADQQLSEAKQYGSALQWEDEVERAHRELEGAKALKRLSRKLRFRSVTRRAAKHAPLATDDLAEQIGLRRQNLLKFAVGVLQLGSEGAVSRAKRDERRIVRELQDALKRDQKAHRNFSFFDHLKSQAERAQKMLGILPVWILSPDDVARLFPCKPDLFDVVIVDEASQVDLPSIAPIAYRGKKLVIFGDTKQMQSQRFAFMSRNVALEAWSQFDMNRFDPVQRFHPTNTSLLWLAAIQAEEESLLDEHFRSLPPIIDFSNRRWYDGRLRIMTDVQRKRYGKPGQLVIELHHVPNGMISNASQENEAEARALVDYLARMVKDPDYSGASIGVLCLFDEQVALVHELVTDEIDPEEWQEHELVVVNPDGFQGDERDVILYSLSWDNSVMPRAALSARQQDSPHIQGMLNVAFTRARDEIHIFHSAPVDTFGMAGGQEGALGAWMTHCAAVQAGHDRRESPRAERIDSEFEAQLASLLRTRNVSVMHQYPACGFRIDLLCELDGERVAVECDGELYHKDEHGNLRVEDIERQAILERAGWRVLRVPYRKWLADPDSQVERILAALGQEDMPDDENQDAVQEHGSVGMENPSAQPRRVTKAQRVLIEALSSGLKAEEEVLRYARTALGHRRLGSKIRASLLASARELNHLELVVIEEGEYFLTADGRAASFLEVATPPVRKPRGRPRARTSSRSRSRTRYRGRYYRY